MLEEVIADKTMRKTTAIMSSMTSSPMRNPDSGVRKIRLERNILPTIAVLVILAVMENMMASRSVKCNRYEAKRPKANAIPISSRVRLVTSPIIFLSSAGRAPSQL